MKIGYLEESRAMIAFLNEKLKMESGKLLQETKIPLALRERARVRGQLFCSLRDEIKPHPLTPSLKGRGSVASIIKF